MNNDCLCTDCTHCKVCGLKNNYEEIRNKVVSATKDISSEEFVVSVTCKHYSSFKLTSAYNNSVDCIDFAHNSGGTTSKLTEEWVDTEEIKTGRF